MVSAGGSFERVSDIRGNFSVPTPLDKVPGKLYS